jgi:glyoxylase-like metal-dependent hydrolase (beta-lactamase superfamily II)
MTTPAPTLLAPGVRRLVAPNPGRMTGDGTNTYLIGERRVVVIDPGPAIESHVDALLAAIGDAEVVAIAVTHTHSDHSPAAALLHARTAAPRRGATPRCRDFHDETFTADVPTGDGTVLATDAGELIAVATPGHASNHLCWFEPATGRLYTGDHILGTVSPVILPPDGDMGEYLDSLQRLAALGATCLLPGHGPVLADPGTVIATLVRHRLMREARVLAALDGAGPATLEMLLPRVYADVDPALYGIAAYSLEAHLIKLRRDGRVQQRAGRWSLA